MFTTDRGSARRVAARRHADAAGRSFFAHAAQHVTPAQSGGTHARGGVSRQPTTIMSYYRKSSGDTAWR
jgi:hypothetical protein